MLVDIDPRKDPVASAWWVTRLKGAVTTRWISDFTIKYDYS